MLETEIKKLTAAVEALTAAMGGDHASDNQTAAPAASAQAAAPTPAPVTTQAPPAAAPPAPAQGAPVATPTPSFEEVKAHLSAVAQRMGDGGAGVSNLVAQCTDVNGNPVRLLSMIDPAQYATLIQKADALVQGAA